MKRAIVIVLCVIAANSSFAQLTITPEIGYNRSTFFTSAPPTQIATDALNGMQFGALISKTLYGHLYLQTGLQFSQKGSYQGRGTQAVYGSNSNIRVNYLQAPINLGLRYRLYNDFGIDVSGGLYGAAGMSGTDKGSSTDIYGSSSVNRKITFDQSVSSADNSKTYIKRFDGGYNFSIALFYKNIDLKTTYSKSSGNIYPVGTTNYKNEVWNFSVGYSFSLK